MNSTQSVPRFLLPQLSWKEAALPLRAARRCAITPHKRQSWANSHATAFHLARNAPRPALAPPSLLGVLQSPASRQAFHATEPQCKDHYFDTLKVVQRLQSEGFTEEQSVAMMKTLNDVIEERSVMLAARECRAASVD